MKFINLRRPGSKPVFVVLPTENRKYTFYINSVKVRTWDSRTWSHSSLKVNLKKGTITVPPDEPEVVQHICLAFVTATLYLLVQPRPPKVEEAVSKRGNKKVKAVYEDNSDCVLLYACGWQEYQSLPSNSHIKHNCGGGEAAGCCSGGDMAGCGGCG